jgi:hypothetical protein
MFILYIYKCIFYIYIYMCACQSYTNENHKMYETEGASYLFWLMVHILHVRNLKPTLLDISSLCLCISKFCSAGEICPLDCDALMVRYLSQKT